MKLSDLLPNPVDTLTAPFKGRDGMPWAQATARNLGHAAFGDKIGDYVDQNWLQRQPPQSQAPQPMQAPDPSQQAMQALIQRWLQPKQ